MIHKRIIVTLILLFVITIGGLFTYYRFFVLCNGPVKTLACIQKNYLRIPPDSVWDALDLSFNRAKACTSVDDMANFLKWAGKGDGYLGETITEDLRDLFLFDSQCFLRGYLLSDQTTQRKLKQILEYDTDYRNQIITEIRKYLNDRRFDFFTGYFF